ncbi:S24/S26 family peptidase [Microbacterium album]|uniref:Peptidase S26 domain-containing protein n=1 Tax=Microbacterium album TaxID=2053191 RepID=A0A917IFK4_9MICO|nr:S24/S26 family peptidase [Microbacterium album]GGH38741.1 hypothetical protein GCM10010921_09500 [Microbacterium album]
MRVRTARALSRVRWTAMIALGVLLVVPLLLPLAGVRLVSVDGGSMAPTYRPGEALLVADPPATRVGVGEPVLVGDPPAAYVHRVIAVDGDLLRLQGDANATADPGTVHVSEVTGVIAVHLAHPAGAVVSAVTVLPGRILLAGLVVLLLVLPVLAPRRPSGRSPAGDDRTAGDEPLRGAVAAPSTLGHR